MPQLEQRTVESSVSFFRPGGRRTVMTEHAHRPGKY
jgi:hypothetical protein